VHHINGDKHDLTYENLVYVCQRCHLHIQSRWVPGGILPAQWQQVPEWITRRGLPYVVEAVQLSMFE
jgi:hypothetical protein